MKPLHRLWRFLVPEPVQLSTAEKLRTSIGAFLGILTVVVVSAMSVEPSALPLVSASMGASAVLLFAIPTSPLAQPWPFAGSHLISATIGVACALWVDQPALAAALAVSLAVLAMHYSHTLHPPGGATALLPVLLGDAVRQSGFHFVLMPIALNVAALLVAAIVVNNLLLRRRYPALPLEPDAQVPVHEDAMSKQQAVIGADDVHHALAEMDVYLDISEEELNRLVRSASAHAARRHWGTLTCGDVMNREVTSVGAGMMLDEVLGLLQRNAFLALPVLDGQQRLIGVIGPQDLPVMVLPRGDDGNPNLAALQAADVMRKVVHTVSHSTPVADIVSLFVRDGLQHLPVVDDEQRLAGLIFPGNLLAAMHAGALKSAR